MAVFNGIAVILFIASCAFTRPAAADHILQDPFHESLQDCRGTPRLDFSERRTLNSLKNNEMSIYSFQESVLESPAFDFPMSCEDGPERHIHTAGPNHFHYPPIYKGICDHLSCDTLNCLVRKKVFRSKCVHTWELVDTGWVYLGPKLIRYVDHTRCGCTQCSDIGTRTECLRHSRTCPNNDTIANNFCHWRCRGGGMIPIDLTAGIPRELPTIPEGAPPGVGPGSFAMQNSMEEGWEEQNENSDVNMQLSIQPIDPIGPIGPGPLRWPCCDCCEPYPCPTVHHVFNTQFCLCVCVRQCPPHMVLNKEKCECECPPGSWMNLNTQECIGSCDRVQDLNHCEKVTCVDSQHFKCKVNRQKRTCECPSCDDVTEKNYPMCSRTKCTEQPGKPKCVLDEDSRRCRCPNCEDENHQEMCVKITCPGVPLNTPCSWDSRNQQCRCRVIG